MYAIQALLAQALAKALRLNRNSLCFCGSGCKYKQCHIGSSGTDILFIQRFLVELDKYRTSQGGRIESIPQGIYRPIQNASTARLTCLYPTCTKKPVSCHFIPETMLRSSFGGHCLEHQLRDKAHHGSFVTTGVDKAGTIHAFCSTHDNDMFRKIDSPILDFTSKEQQFLLAFKVVAFSLRSVQLNLGIDIQAEFIKLMKAVNQIRTTPIPADKKPHIHIDLSSLLGEQYQRFVVTHNIYRNTLKALLKQDLEFFSFFHRCVDYGEPLFFGALINPSHDLERQRINKSTLPINMACIIVTQNGKLHLLLACPDGLSKKAYAPFLRQLATANTKTFITVINNIIAASASYPLLPTEFVIDNGLTGKTHALLQRSKECLKTSAAQVFNLKDASRMVEFIKGES